MGHYSVAKLFGTAVDRFSIGFGKPIWKRVDRSGTEWTISRVPLGGYVKFMGDAGAASNPDQSLLEQIRSNIEKKHGPEAVQSCFHFKPLWQRVLIVLAGPLANFVLAVLLFAIVALFFGQRDVRTIVQSVLPDSAAEEAGVLVGDRFLTLDDRNVEHYSDFVSYVVVRSGQTLEARIERDGQIISKSITPRRTERRDAIGGKNNIGMVGVQIGGESNQVVRSYGPVGALGQGVEQFNQTLSMTGTYIKRIFQGREDGKALGGPTRIATMTGKTTVDVVKLDVSLKEKVKYLAHSLLMLSAALSIGLGVANLMPIPALDGGHLLYYGYEAIAGRPLSEDKQEFGFRIGFAILLTGLVFLTVNDIGYIRSIFS